MQRRLDVLQLRWTLQLSGLRRVKVPDWISNRVSTPPKHILAIFVKMMTNRYLYNRQRCIFVSIWFLKFYHQKVKNTFSICSRKQIFDNIKKNNHQLFLLLKFFLSFSQWSDYVISIFVKGDNFHRESNESSHEYFVYKILKFKVSAEKYYK